MSPRSRSTALEATHRTSGFRRSEEVTVRRRLLGARSSCVVADQRLPRDGGVTIGARGGRRISEVASPDRLMQTPS
jgi:hypothetical protein